MQPNNHFEVLESCFPFQYLGVISYSGGSQLSFKTTCVFSCSSVIVQAATQTRYVKKGRGGEEIE